MQKDVQFGLILAVAIVIACASKRISLSFPAQAAADTKTTNQAPHDPASQTKAKDALTLPSMQPNKTKADPAKTSESPDPLGNALADLFPKDLREKSQAKQTKPAQNKVAPLVLPFNSNAAPKNKTTTQTKTQQPEPALDLTLPGDDFLDPAKHEPTPDQKSKPSSDTPKRLPEADKPSTKKPVHPYFQRFLDEGSYFVRDGDTLQAIALNLYQNEDMVEAIIRANPEFLTAPDDLKPGTRITLPK